MTFVYVKNAESPMNWCVKFCEIIKYWYSGLTDKGCLQHALCVDGIFMLHVVIHNALLTIISYAVVYLHSMALAEDSIDNLD